MRGEWDYLLFYSNEEEEEIIITQRSAWDKYKGKNHE